MNTSKFANSAILLCTVLVCVLVGEILVRLLEPAQSQFEFILPRPDTRRLYELRPSSTGHLLGKPIAINSLGLRDFEISRQKPPNVVRVIGLGDSMTMAPGVDPADTYLRRLGGLLNTRRDARRYEVLNFGVWGYNTVQEVDLFVARGVALSPDIVLLGFFPNDAGKSEGLKTDPRTFLHGFMRQSRLFAFLKPRVSALGRMLNLPIRTYVSSIIEDYAEGSSTWRDCQDALRSLNRLSFEHGFKLIVVMIPMSVDLDSGYPLREVHQKVSDFCQEEGISFWDALAVFENQDASTLRISITDSHFNVKANALLAGFLHERLSAQFAHDHEPWRH